MIEPLFVLAVCAGVFLICACKFHDGLRTGRIHAWARAGTPITRAAHPAVFWLLIALLGCLATVNLAVTLWVVYRIKQVGLFAGLP